jgi:hypothetical protein
MPQLDGSNPQLLTQSLRTPVMSSAYAGSRIPARLPPQQLQVADTVLSALMQEQQLTLELQRQATNSLHDPQLLTALLGHHSISREQHIIAALQATSKQLQAAVAQQLLGQLPVVLRTDAPRRMHALAQWLQKHAGLCQGLDLQVSHNSEKSSWVYVHGGLLVRDVRWPDAVAAVAKALQDAAAAAGSSMLRSVSLTGNAAEASILQQIPPQQLTQLRLEVDYSSSASLQAIAALPGLRSLHLTVPAGTTWRTADDFLAPLAAGLQQLTELQIGPVRLAQPKQLPPKLQQLHVTINLNGDLQQLAQVASWLQRISGGIIKSLGLQNGPIPEDSATFKATMGQLVAFIQAAASRDQVRLESLTLRGSAGTLLQQLPVCSLTQLKCFANWGSLPAAAAAAAVGAICSMTSLRSLQLPYSGINMQRNDALTPLSTLQQLMQLQFWGGAQRAAGCSAAASTAEAGVEHVCV